jgi:hypothetical protein
MIFVWKNAMQMIRQTSIVALLRYGAPALVITVSMTALMLRNEQGAQALFGTASAAAAFFSVLLGPQLARTDLRQDLLHLELLKTWPMRGAQVIRGEMLWPAALLIGTAWIAIAVAFVFWTTAFAPATVAWRLSAAIAAILLAPALVLAQFTIHNSAAVIFPAWVPLGTSRPKGVDAMGQRIIMFAGVLLGLAAMLAPGAIAGAILWFAFQRIIGAYVLIPAAAACTALVFVEVLLVTEALGPVYDRLDLSGVERSES